MEQNYCDDCYLLMQYARQQGLHRLETRTGKVKQMLKILKDAMDRGEKTIVYSQWTKMLDVVEPVLREEGISYVRCMLECSLSRLAVLMALFFRRRDYEDT